MTFGSGRTAEAGEKWHGAVAENWGRSYLLLGLILDLNVKRHDFMSACVSSDYNKHWFHKK